MARQMHKCKYLTSECYESSTFSGHVVNQITEHTDYYNRNDIHHPTNDYLVKLWGEMCDSGRVGHLSCWRLALSLRSVWRADPDGQYQYTLHSSESETAPLEKRGLGLVMVGGSVLSSESCLGARLFSSNIDRKRLLMTTYGIVKPGPPCSIFNPPFAPILSFPYEYKTAPKICYFSKETVQNYFALFRAPLYLQPL